MQSAGKLTNDHEKSNAVCSDISFMSIKIHHDLLYLPQIIKNKYTQGAFQICPKRVYPTFIPIFVQSSVHRTIAYHKILPAIQDLHKTQFPVLFYFPPYLFMQSLGPKGYYIQTLATLKFTSKPKKLVSLNYFSEIHRIKSKIYFSNSFSFTGNAEKEVL